MPDPMGKKWVSIVAGIVLLVVWLGALGWSLAAGTPKELPGVALGSAALLHVIRATVATALVGAVGVLLVRGFAGRWPAKFSTTGIEYAHEVAQAQTEVEQDISRLLAIAAQHEDRLDEVARRLDVR